MKLFDLHFLASSTGIPAEVLSPGIVLAASYILSIPFVFLHSPTSRGLFSILASSLLFLAVFDVFGLVQIVALSSACYTLSRWRPTSSTTPLLVIILSLSTLAAKLKFFSDITTSRFDETVPMMIAVQKMATFAWSVYDGTRPRRELSTTQQALTINTKTFPSLLDYLGFIFFYPAFILGPSFHFRTYWDFITDSGPFKLVDKSAKILPGRWPYLFKTISIGLSLSLLNIALSPYFPYEFGLDALFLEWSIFRRVGYFFIASLAQQAQFFGAWKLAEGACVLCGFGYVGRGGKKEDDEDQLKQQESQAGSHIWNRCENVRIWELEFPENPRMFMSAWNVQTALWLRTSIYLRLAPEPLPDQTPQERLHAKSNASIATHVTFLVSAFWHGFYPGYYSFFLTLSLLVSSNRITRKHLRPYFHNQESWLHKLLPIYNFLGWLATVFSISYATIAMQLRTLESGFTVWKRLYFFGHMGIAVLYIADLIISISRKKSHKEEIVVNSRNEKK
ncbi:MBOAT, membrane-bound O-acyltransferase family-domain-containing protein [Obelidium mucronatum]|nr:MBOAT, membrane-bound O-acyltransferase family-domain-containing protein [Obelidium mucronatum]